MTKRRSHLLTYALLACALLMVMLFISRFTRGLPMASTALSIAIIFFEITAPFEILRRLAITPRECNIYAHNIDTTLDLLFPPFGRLRNKPDFPAMGKELLFLLGLMLAIFIPYVLCYWGYFLALAYQQHATVIIQWNFPPQLLYEIVTQIFVIALPEEIFYRGFLQSALMRALPQRRPMSFVSEAVIITNLIFAFGHVASTFNPTRMLTFFPGLVFSYLVLRNKSLFSAILFHAACNILGQILYGSFFLN